MKKFWITFLFGLICSPASLTAAPSNSTNLVEAQTKLQYSDRIRAIPRRPLLKSGRFELTPRIGTTLNDPYYYHSTVGAGFTFFPSEFWGIGIGGNYVFSSVKTAHLEWVRQGMLARPAEYELPSVFGYLELHWIPIYGKLSLFSRRIFHFETYLTVGAGIHTENTQLYRPAGVISIGQRLALNKWCTFSLELRDLIYQSSYSLYDEKRSTVLHYLALSAGFSFYLPPSFEYSQQ